MEDTEYQRPAWVVEKLRQRGAFEIRGAQYKADLSQQCQRGGYSEPAACPCPAREMKGEMIQDTTWGRMHEVCAQLTRTELDAHDVVVVATADRPARTDAEVPLYTGGKTAAVALIDRALDRDFVVRVSRETGAPRTVWRVWGKVE